MTQASQKIKRSALLLVRAFGKASWLPEGLRRRFVNQLFPLQKAPHESFTVKFRGNSIFLQLDDFIDNRIFFYNKYEEAELDFIRFAAQRYGCGFAVDIGANSGIHTIEMSRVFRHVQAFEPLPSVREKLLKRLDDNGVSNVTVFDFALGSEEGRFDYYVDTESMNRGMGSFDRAHNAAGVVVDAFEVRRGDEVFDSTQEIIDFIKIDVEGWEPEVLIGLIGTIGRCAPVLMFELTKSSVNRPSFNEAFDRLKAEGYNFYFIKHNSKKFQRYSFDLLSVRSLEPAIGGSNYVAIPKDSA